MTHEKGGEEQYIVGYLKLECVKISFIEMVELFFLLWLYSVAILIEMTLESESGWWICLFFAKQNSLQVSIFYHDMLKNFPSSKIHYTFFPAMF